MPKAAIEAYDVELVSLTSTFRRSSGEVVRQDGRGPRLRLKIRDVEPLPGEALAANTQAVELLFDWNDELGVPRVGDLGLVRYEDRLEIHCQRDDFDRIWQLLRVEDSAYLSWAEPPGDRRTENWAISTDGGHRFWWTQRPEERPLRESIEPARRLADVVASALIRSSATPGVDRTSEDGEDALASALLDAVRRSALR